MDSIKLRNAYLLWRRKKSIKNFKLMLRDGFTGGVLLWRIWRVIKNTLSGKYENLYEKYWKEYDLKDEKHNTKYNEILNTFIDSFDNGTNCLYYFNEKSIPRGFGKTSILNEIGLIAQSQGMEVLSWSAYYGTTHIATERIVAVNDLRCHNVENTILLIDEVNVNDATNASMIEHLRGKGMRMFGFIRYE